MALDIPAFKGSYSGFTVKGEIRTAADGQPTLEISVNYGTATVFAIGIRASDAAGELRHVFNLLAPVIKEFGDDFAEWFRNAMAKMFPRKVQAVAKIGGRAIPARFAARLGGVTEAPDPATQPDAIVPPDVIVPPLDPKPLPADAIDPKTLETVEAPSGFVPEPPAVPTENPDVPVQKGTPLPPKVKGKK
jgi:hypothetical protein